MIIDRGLTYLTAWDIYTKQKHDQQVRGSFPLYTIVKDKVVMAPKSQLAASPIYVWDLSSNRVQEVGTFKKLILYHTDPAKNVYWWRLKSTT